VRSRQVSTEASLVADIKALKNIFMMELKGLIQGIRFVYYGYYYTGKDETIQLITYTYQSEFEEYKTELEKMLNGLVINKIASNSRPNQTAKSAQ
jgi:hypothetical protein